MSATADLRGTSCTSILPSKATMLMLQVIGAEISTYILSRAQHPCVLAIMATGYVLERLSELREEAYCKVLRCFLASQQYDLVSSLQPPSTIRPPPSALLAS